MPEGPEIHRAAGKLRRAIANQRAEEVWFAFEHLERNYASTLTGQRIVDVSARGKALLTEFESGLVIYSHNQLYGVWRVVKPNTWPNTTRQLRLAIHTTHRSALLYSASEIEVWETSEIEEHPYIARLGPDPLLPGTTSEAILARYEDARFERRSFSSLLLDQGFVAGVGNYLRSEILHMAEVAPDMRPRDLSPARLQRMAEATITAMQRSFASGGATRSPDEVRELKALGLKRREWRHYVFSRARKACPRCASIIVKETWGGRRLYRCPTCQVLRKEP